VESFVCLGTELTLMVTGLVYEMLMRWGLEYGSETLTMAKHGDSFLRSFDSILLQIIFCLVIKNGCWRRHENSEIYKLYDEYDNVRFINLAVLRGLVVLEEGLQPIARWNCGFECRCGHGRLSLVSVVCYQVEVTMTGRSLIQMSPTDCYVSLCVI
jgi:hypothetical protein